MVATVHLHQHSGAMMVMLHPWPWVADSAAAVVVVVAGVTAEMIVTLEVVEAAEAAGLVTMTVEAIAEEAIIEDHHHLRDVMKTEGSVAALLLEAADGGRKEPALVLATCH